MGEGSGRGPILTGVGAWAGILVFALFVHRPSPYFLLAVGGLLATTVAITAAAAGGSSFRNLFGLDEVPPRTRGWTLVALGVAVGFGFLLRGYRDQPLILTGLGSFLLVGAAIGATEELLFRGFIQGRMVRLGAPAAIVLAALAHTSYKTALFALPPEGVAVNLSVLAFFTFLVGAILGLTRHKTGSVIPALSGHMLFDILVYGDWAQAPWWVWGVGIQ